MELLYEDKTRLLKAMFFDVQNEVGLGRQEEAYQRACEIWLQEQRIPFVSKPPQRLTVSGLEAYVMYPDLVVWDCITVELKAVPRTVTSAEFVQVFNYLKCRRDRLGFLANLGLDRVHDERIIFDPPSASLSEEWKYWEGEITGEAREIGVAIRQALRALYDEHGTGYGDEVFERLLLASLGAKGLNLVVRPVTKAWFRGVEVHESPVECLVVEGRVVVTFSALFDEVQFSVNRGLSCLKSLGLQWGVAMNFGKTRAEITGLRRR